MNKQIKFDIKNRVDFKNNIDSCIGTGRLGLALTEEYLKELEFVQEEIGFKFIRGHGIFHDDLSIYHEYEEDGEIKLEYNYTYLFRIIDRFIELGIRPYLELSFMPSQLAKGTQTLFHWKANTTPPKEYRLWNRMVVALLKNLRARYGEEVLDWPIEVWNEPNLPGFWFKGDMDEYFKLFKETYTAIKEYDSRFKVGGPAICGVNEDEWTREFLSFCKRFDIKPDNITRHHYTVEFPETVGHYDYSKLEDSNMRIANQKVEETGDSGSACHHHKHRLFLYHKGKCLGDFILFNAQCFRCQRHRCQTVRHIDNPVFKAILFQLCTYTFFTHFSSPDFISRKTIPFSSMASIAARASTCRHSSSSNFIPGWKHLAIQTPTPAVSAPAS